MHSGPGGHSRSIARPGYSELEASSVTLATYLKTLKFTVLTWFFCTIIGFTVAYFLEWPMPFLAAKASGAYDEALGMNIVPHLEEYLSRRIGQAAS